MDQTSAAARKRQRLIAKRRLWQSAVRQAEASEGLLGNAPGAG